MSALDFHHCGEEGPCQQFLCPGRFSTRLHLPFGLRAQGALASHPSLLSSELCPGAKSLRQKVHVWDLLQRNTKGIEGPQPSPPKVSPRKRREIRRGSEFRKSNPPLETEGAFHRNFRKKCLEKCSRSNFLTLFISV